MPTETISFTFRAELNPPNTKIDPDYVTLVALNSSDIANAQIVDDSPSSPEVEIGDIIEGQDFVLTFWSQKSTGGGPSVKVPKQRSITNAFYHARPKKIRITEKRKDPGANRTVINTGYPKGKGRDK
jgi:hypothetical protein